LDPEVLHSLEQELQRLVEGRLARDADEVTDLLRILGPLTTPELVLRCAPGLAGGLDEALGRLAEDRRIISVAVAGEDRWAAAEDAGLLRDALGCAIPVGLPGVFTDPVDAPLEGLVVRYGRTHGPFLDRDVAARLGIDAGRIRPLLDALVADGRLVRGEFRPGGAEREWCDPEALRQLRRRSLAVLRAEVEPVDGAALGRFLPAWQGVGLPRKGIDGLVEVLGVLAGASVPASVLESDVLPSRMAEYRPSDLDALCTAGDLVWLGASPLGSTDGRVRLVFRDQVELLVPEPTAGERPEGLVHDALRAHLAQRGASFWAELVGAAAAAETDYDDATVLAALWDLVWAGEVTNDSLAPLRAFVSASGGRRSSSGPAPRGRPRPGRLSRLGPPTGAGRWSLVSSLRGPLPGQAPPSATEIAHARAMQLLERYGVLTREAALGEGIVGGFAGVYPVLKALEERGAIRRGYFVAGLGAAQFAVPGAVDRLRSAREPRRADALGGEDGRGGGDTADVAVLAATDPAQPYGASLPWPPTDGRPARAAGALVVLVAGEAAAYVEKGGRSLLAFPAAAADDRWPEALAAIVRRGQRRSLEIAKIDGAPARESAHADSLRSAGFADGYKGLVLRNR
ncbi:MAG TPA: crosslink repair DNA glycosylase YcaQ family protein, partial [Acidimicrobiales bacterium]|nr:crosslink repair DNA glycosylase YcaQ family protein [Acidimicrobiales bacterium]